MNAISKHDFRDAFDALSLDDFDRSRAGRSRGNDLLDFSALRQLEEDSEPFPISEMIEIFIEEAQKHRKIICGALRAKDVETLRKEAHSVKGSAATFGTKRLRQIASEVEVSCIEKNEEQAMQVAGGIPTMIDASLEALATHYGLAL